MLFQWLRQWREERRRVKRLQLMIERLERNRLALNQTMTDLHVKYIEVVKQASDMERE